MSKNVPKARKDLFHSIREVIESARSKAWSAINTFLLESYWQIGRLIVEDEQQGTSRAKYGEAVLKNLAEQLTMEFGRGFDLRNLSNMRAFYTAFPTWYAVRTELSWTHYRIIFRLETEEKRRYSPLQRRYAKVYNS